MFSSPAQAAPQLPPENAAMQQPDGAAVKSASQRRATQKNANTAPTVLTSGRGVTSNAPTSKAGLSTILTSAAGVMNAAPTEKKQLLGA
jgi:hypothetical protein